MLTALGGDKMSKKIIIEYKKTRNGMITSKGWKKEYDELLLDAAKQEIEKAIEKHRKFRSKNVKNFYFEEELLNLNSGYYCLNAGDYFYFIRIK